MSMNLNNFEKLGVDYNVSQYGNTDYHNYFSSMYNHLLNLVVDPSTREVKSITFDNNKYDASEETLKRLEIEVKEEETY